VGGLKEKTKCFRQRKVVGLGEVFPKERTFGYVQAWTSRGQKLCPPLEKERGRFAGDRTVIDTHSERDAEEHLLKESGVISIERRGRHPS